MRSVDDIAATLGQYMLKGWVLTDVPCRDCGNIVMRSPDGFESFCANCSSPLNSSKPIKPQSSSSLSSSSHISRSSTPPTEISSTISSPVFATPVDTEESIRRRQQSDTASAEIGKRLLKGWAMLADECPNARCYGVPLVRPPKAGHGKDPRKECVICETVYINQNDGSGWERLVPLRDEAVQSTARNITTPELVPVSRDGGRDLEEPPQVAIAAQSLATLPKAETAHQILGPLLPATGLPDALKQSESTPPTLSALEASARSLELTLYTLSERLTVLSKEQTTVDFGSMGLVADAIYRVTQALGQVKQLQWSQRQTSYS